MRPPDQADQETDSRFPSGPWTGYFLQPALPGRNRMEIAITFRQGQMTGHGRDRVGDFTIRGLYTVADGKCHWTKRYLGKHDVFYQGFNEGKGIWGVWEIPPSDVYAPSKGGFHIWPEGMPDPSVNQLTEAVEEPVIVHQAVEQENLEPATVGSERVPY